jgi:hypothetical protein
VCAHRSLLLHFLVQHERALLAPLPLPLFLLFGVYDQDKCTANSGQQRAEGTQQRAGIRDETADRRERIIIHWKLRI